MHDGASALMTPPNTQKSACWFPLGPFQGQITLSDLYVQPYSKLWIALQENNVIVSAETYRKSPGGMNHKWKI